MQVVLCLNKLLGILLPLVCGDLHQKVFDQCLVDLDYHLFCKKQEVTFWCLFDLGLEVAELDRRVEDSYYSGVFVFWGAFLLKFCVVDKFVDNPEESDYRDFDCFFWHGITRGDDGEKEGEIRSDAGVDAEGLGVLDLAYQVQDWVELLDLDLTLTLLYGL